MKALKITFAMLSLVVLTVSGTSSDTINVDEKPNASKTNYSYDLVSHDKDGRVIEKVG